MEQGWIKLDRAIVSHWIFEDAWKFRAWIDLLILANHQSKKVVLGNQIFMCERGELLYSLDSLSKRWRVERSRTRRFLQLLQSESMIVLKDERKTTRITICKYESYQGERNANETQMKRERNANETQTHTNKNDNNDNNVNNDKKVYTSTHFFNDLLSLGIDEQLANDVIEHRKKSKGIFTQRSFNGLKGELDKFALGEKKSAADALTFLVEQTSWRTFTYEFYKNRNKSQQNQNNAKKHQYQIHVAEKIDFGNGYGTLQS